MAKHYKQYRTDSIRLQTWDYTKPSWYYVTICTKHKIQHFGSVERGKILLNEIGKIVEEEWLNSKMVRDNVELDKYIVMPDHLHGIIILKPNTILNKINKIGRNVSSTLQPGSLGSIIGQFKSVCTKRIRKKNPNFEWQKNYYEHIIRDETDLLRIRDYIEKNPLKWNK